MEDEKEKNNEKDYNKFLECMAVECLVPLQLESIMSLHILLFSLVQGKQTNNQIIKQIQKFHSRLFNKIPIGTGWNGVMTSDWTRQGNPRASRIVKVFAPNALAIAMFADPCLAAMIEEKRDGRDAPMAVMVRPVMSSSIPSTHAKRSPDWGWC